ncbi:MAG: hypothetical protein J7L86_01280 [Candidatus Marinimicrobia bacterium]|nr:hypothetical protein [Candidatus Neomarinimicrobiota bacterium]
MNKYSKEKNDKAEKVAQINEMIHSFCGEHLTQELEGYAVKLCEKLGRKRIIDITRGKKEIWAASVIYVIARLNFLFDKQNENYITVDTICNYFGTKKSTIGTKATQIEKTCNLSIGAEGYCSKEISDSFTFYQTPEGFIIPKSMIDNQEFIIEFADGEEAGKLQEFADEKRRIEEEKIKKRKERRAEINREIAEKKKEKKKEQLNLFGD